MGGTLSGRLVGLLTLSSNHMTAWTFFSSSNVASSVKSKEPTLKCLCLNVLYVVLLWSPEFVFHGEQQPDCPGAWILACKDVAGGGQGPQCECRLMSQQLTATKLESCAQLHGRFFSQIRTNWTKLMLILNPKECLICCLSFSRETNHLNHFVMVLLWSSCLSLCW